MPTLKNAASDSKTNENQEILLVQSEPIRISTRQEPEHRHKKRRHKDNGEESEKPNKKRARQEFSPGSRSESIEKSDATPNNAGLGVESAASKENKKKHHKRSKDTESSSLTEQSVEGTPETSQPSANKQKKKKKSLPTFAIDPQLLHGPSSLNNVSPEASPSPEPRSLRPLEAPETEFVDYSMMHNPSPFPFSNESIDPSTFGLNPGASSDDILRVIKNMDLSALTRPASQDVPSTSKSAASRRKLNLENAQIPTITNATDQAKLLSTKWLTTKALKKLNEEQG